MEFERNITSRAKLNMTPLIDMVFLLVVFFMLTSSFNNEEGIEINFSSNEGGAEKPTSQKVIKIYVNEETIYLDDKKYDYSSFYSSLKDRLLNLDNPHILVSGSKESTVQDVIKIVDQINLAGGTNIIFVK